MSELRGPVRHGSRARRPVRPVSVQQQVDVDGEVADALGGEAGPSPDLQAVFAALARRSKLPTGPDARPTEVLRAAGLPLLMAAIVASGQGGAGLDAVEAAPAPGNPQPGVSGWTVTTPQQVGVPPATAALGGASAGAGTTASAPQARPAARHAPSVTTSAPPARATPPKAAPPKAGPPKATPSKAAPPRATASKAAPPKAAPSKAAAPRAAAPRAAAPSVAPPKVAPRKVAPPKSATTRPAQASTARTPARTTPATSAPARTTPPATAHVTREYVVRAGDTLSGISQSQHVRLPDVLRLNGLAMESVIYPGDRLRIPDAPGTPATSGTQGTPGTVSARTAEGSMRGPVTGSGYVVRPNDSLIGISQEQHVKLQDLLELNGLHLESVIHPGDRLRLPAPKRPAEHTYPPAVVAAADANRRMLAHAQVPSRAQVQGMVVSTARSMGVDPALALGVAYLESGFQQRVVSPANAVGVMQVIPSAGRWASTMVGRPLDLLDAKDNIVAGIALLRALTRAADTEAQAIAGYYQGLSSVQRNGMFDDTRRYVANVQTLKSRFATGS